MSPDPRLQAANEALVYRATHQPCPLRVQSRRRTRRDRAVIAAMVAAYLLAVAAMVAIVVAEAQP